MKRFLFVTFTLLLFHCFTVAEFSSVKGRVESCPGCKLNHLKDVKKFIYEDLPKYADITFKKIQGAIPELVILNEDDTEKERISLVDKNREECNFLLLERGFKLKLAAKAEL